jgi:Fungal specific transcription factor domain
MKLPSPAITQELLKVFFSEANWYFTVLDQFYFDKAHRTWSRSWNSIPAATEQQISAESLYFPALLFQVLALGVQFVPSNSAAEKAALSLNASSLDQLSQHLSETGERILNMLGRHIHAITAIQANLMRCAWLKNSGRGAEAWYSLGNAVR